MIHEYHDVFNSVRKEVECIGGSLEFNSEYSATFSLRDGWRVILEGDKFTIPSFDLLITCTDDPLKEEYSIWVLMQAFRVEDPPTIVNQFIFLKKHEHDIFKYPVTYKRKYNDMNSIE